MGLTTAYSLYRSKEVLGFQPVPRGRQNERECQSILRLIAMCYYINLNTLLALLGLGSS
jgi:hypothetical protein